MNSSPITKPSPPKPSGFDPGLQCLAAVFVFTVAVRLILSRMILTRSREILIVGLGGVFVGLIVLIVISAIVWSRRATSPRPGRRWALIVALVWESLQLLAYLSIMFQQKFAS